MDIEKVGFQVPLLSFCFHTEGSNTELKSVDLRNHNADNQNDAAGSIMKEAYIQQK